MSRLALYIKTYIFRVFQTIGRYCDLYLSPPSPQPPSFTLRIPSTIGSVPGSFKLLFYTPPGYKLSQQSSKKYPVLVNFHGGGYSLGHAADDARWATSVIQKTECVVISVDYRLAPRYPFPTGIEDCVSAILYLWANADSLHLDASRTAISGFSAGGNYSFTAPIRLHQEIARLKAEDLIAGVELGRLVGIVAFYPAVDWTRSRDERAASNPNAKPVGVPKWMFGVFDASYLYPKPADMRSPLLSPGLADEVLLKEALPEKVCFVTCWGDGLLGEGEAFRERLRGLGSVVSGFMVPGVVHGWDKWPSWGKATRERDEAYRVAGESLKDMFG